MSEEKILVEQTENVEITTEEIPAAKTYTQEEVDAIVGKAKARTRAKVEKENERKYAPLMNTLKAGTGKESVEEINDTFEKFYTGKGIKISKEPSYSAKDIEILARAEAEDIIRGGYEDVVEEVDRLADIGVGKMTAKEKAVFKVLAEHRQNAERGHELGKIGVTEDVYNSPEFLEFAGKFNSNTPIRDIYDIYNKTKPRKEHKTMGSMKQRQETGAKDYYTPEEIERLTMKDLDDPKVWEAVRRSMTGR